MGNDNDFKLLSKSLAELDENSVLRLSDALLKQQMMPLEIVQALAAGMEEVGRLYKEEEYALSELIYAGVIFKSAMAGIRPFLLRSDTVASGMIVMGTVKGDIHDLGKNIIIMLLECYGFKVIDLGVDVPKEKFVESVKESGAKLMGMSALLTTTLPEMKEVIRVLDDTGLRNQVQVMIGGAITSEKFRQEISADFYGKDAIEGIRIAKQVFNTVEHV
jgi:methylmalonyl-CoA mutase cobalamin-binding domain/chain